MVEKVFVVLFKCWTKHTNIRSSFPFDLKIFHCSPLCHLLSVRLVSDHFSRYFVFVSAEYNTTKHQKRIIPNRLLQSKLRTACT